MRTSTSLLGLALGGILAAGPAPAGEPEGHRGREPAASAPGGIAIHGEVLGPDGRPLSDAAVALRPGGGLRPAFPTELPLDTEPAPVAETTSDEGGRFVLAAPEPGSWRVSVAVPGMAPQELVVFPVFHDSHLPPVTLQADLGLEVRVVDSQGKPVAGAQVSSQQRARGPAAGSPWLRPMVEVTVTDEDGRARLTRQEGERLRLAAASDLHALARAEASGRSAILTLPPGARRIVRVTEPGGRPLSGVALTVREGLVLGRTDSKGVATVLGPAGGSLELLLVASYGAMRRVELEIPEGEDPLPAQLLVLEPARRISGQVVAQGGRPVAEALVWRGFGAPAFSDSAGGFALEAPDGDTVHLTVTAPGHSILGSSHRLPAEGSSAPGLRIELAPPRTLEGTAVDEAGRPLEEVAVAALLADMGMVPGVHWTGMSDRTGPEGRFALRRLPPDRPLLVRLRKTGYAARLLELPPGVPGQTHELEVTLERGLRGLGRVVDVEQRPIAGAQVRLEQTPVSGSLPRRFSPPSLEPSLRAATDGAGRFAFDDLASGRVQLTARAPGFAPTVVPGVEVTAGRGRAADLGTLVLAPGAEVRGRAVDAEGGPLDGAEIFVYPAGSHGPMRRSEPDAVTSADGAFVLGERRLGERLDLHVWLQGYGPQVRETEAGGEEPLVIVLEASGTVAGQLLDQDGQPVAGARLRLHDTVAGPGRRPFGSRGFATSGDSGHFRFEDAPPGAYRVVAEAPGFLPAELRLPELGTGQKLEGLELVMRQGAVVLGTVTGPDGAPVRDAEISMAHDGASAMGFALGSPPRASSDAEGRYRLDGIPPGRRTVRVAHSRFRPARSSLELAAGEQTLDFTLEPGFTVSGRVVDEEGRPVVGATYSLRSRSGRGGRPAAGPATDAAGSFLVEAVTEGRYVLLVDHGDHAPGALEVEIAGESVTGLEVRLTRGASLVGSLSGLELHELVEVRVQAHRPSDGALRGGAVAFDGSYRVEGLGPGPWRVTALVDARGGRRAEAEVEIEPGVEEARLDLEFAEGTELSGWVHDGGEPVAGAEVEITGPGASARTRTDPEGRFHFTGVQEGRRSLAAFDPRTGRNRRLTVEVPGEVEVALRELLLGGRVTDQATGAPVAAALVSVEHRSRPDLRWHHHPEMTSHSDAHGAFHWHAVGEGTWRLTVEREGYARGSATVEVVEGAPAHVEIPLQPAEALVLHPRRADGRIPEAVFVAVVEPTGAPPMLRTYTPRDDGEIHLVGLPTGTWELVVTAPDALIVQQVVTSPGPPQEVILSAAGSLGVRVPDLVVSEARAGLELRSADGQPLSIMVAPGRTLSRFPVTSGTAHLFKVPVGTWQAVVTTPDGDRWSNTVTIAPGEHAQIELR